MNGARLSGGVVCIFLLLYCISAAAVTVSSVSALQTAISNANGGGDTNIIISSSGSPYLLDVHSLQLRADGITISGSTGNRDEVVLDGEYNTNEIFAITGSNITVKDLTLKRAVWHPIHISPPRGGNVVGTLIENVRIIDPGQQAIKINQNHGNFPNYGIIQDSLIELTASGRIEVWNINGSCYTGGVDGHQATGWIVRRNVIKGFWCDGGLSEHGIHFWSFSNGTLVERNQIINCDRGIGFGLGSSGHIDGIIRNNMIYHDTGHNHSDVGIGLESASGAQVYNNTIFHEHTYANAIEYRFGATSGGIIRNNLTNRRITSRNSGSAVVSHNITAAHSSYFKNPAAGDLHLAYRVPGVTDSGIYITGLTNDFDGEARPSGGGVDIGADEVAAPTSKTVAPWQILLME